MSDIACGLFRTYVNCAVNFAFCSLVIMMLIRLSRAKSPLIRYSLMLIPLIKLWYDLAAGILSEQVPVVPLSGLDHQALDLSLAVGFGSSGISLWSMIFSCLIGHNSYSLGDLAFCLTGTKAAIIIVSLMTAVTLFLAARRYCAYHAVLKRLEDSASTDSRLTLLIQNMWPSRSEAPRGILSDRIASPLAAGVIRPVIAIPASLYPSLSDEELRLIVRHEMSHLTRFDNIISQVISLTADIFFFLPFLPHLERQISFERERICDREAIEWKSGQALAFSRAMVKVAEYGLLLRHSCLSTAMAGLSSCAVKEHDIVKRAADLLSLKTGSRTLLDRCHIYNAIALLILKLLIGVSFFTSSSCVDSYTCAAMRIILSA